MSASTKTRKIMDVSHCKGCEDDFYNGKNPLGVTMCWSRVDAQFGQYRLIPIDLVPPFLDVQIQTLPTCYKAKRMVKVAPSALRPDGYWK